MSAGQKCDTLTWHRPQAQVNDIRVSGQRHGREECLGAAEEHHVSPG